MNFLIIKGFRFFFTLISSLFILEILFFLFYPQETSYPLVTTKFGLPNILRANINIKKKGLYGSTYKIITNDKNIRNISLIHYKKPYKSFRILILGDSITFGTSVSNNETFSFYLEKIFLEQINIIVNLYRIMYLKLMILKKSFHLIR